MAAGKWNKINGWDVLEQSDIQSCGYCCCGMVIHLLYTSFPSEQSMITQGKKVAELRGTKEYYKAPCDYSGAVQTFIPEATWEVFGEDIDWGSGTAGLHLAAVLTSQDVDVEYRTKNIKQALRAVSRNQPVIVLVQWDNGGGHWVVATSRNPSWGRASNYTILDPGGQVVSNKGSTTYTAANGAKGKFSNYFVVVKGKKALSPGMQPFKLPGM